MSLYDLLTGKDGRISHVKMWANVACATASGVIIHQEYKGLLSWDIFALYLGTVGVYSVGKYLDIKHGLIKPTEAQESEIK